MGQRLPIGRFPGVLNINGVQIPCAVLDDGRRVFTQRGFLETIGKSKPGGGRGGGADRLPPFITAKNLQPYVEKHITVPTTPILFHLSTGGRAYGYLAELIPQVCEVFLAAHDDRVVLPQQERIVKQCALLVRGLAHVGIAALIDEATGYQKERDRQDLVHILEKYVNPTLRPWVKTFPDEYYQQIFRLHNWPVDQWSTNRPGYVGHITNKIVYERLPPGVLDGLRKKNPSEHGRRRWRHFQFLTADVGNPHLREHLILIIGLMRAAEDWDQFIVFLMRNFAIPGEQLRFDLTYQSDAAFSLQPPEDER